MMYVTSVVLYVFWVLIFITAGDRLREVVKSRLRVSFKEWILITGSLLMPVWFFADRFFL